MKVLITGGAGFIGSRLAARIAADGDDVTILDNLSVQVHGEGGVFAPELEAVARCVRGDVRDPDVVKALCEGQEVIVHLAAETGTGQSMYVVRHYSDANVQGTAVLLDTLVNERSESLKKLVVASSRAIYGEGAYRCDEHGVVYPPARSKEAMEAGQFDPACPACGRAAQMIPTPEGAPFAPSSFYGLTKQVQEQMVLMFAGVLGVDGIALRYQNVYGPGQSLSNPYTGILAIFSNLVRQNKTINIFEDGAESRDFVFVDDVVEATASCLRPDVAGVHALNVGSGVRTSVLDVARAIVEYFGRDVALNITGDFRVGDIRHNVADTSKLQQLTGYTPQTTFPEGLRRFLDWASAHDAEDSGYERSLSEMQGRGLMGQGASK